MPENTAAIVDFLFEVGILAQTPRSGFAYLGVAPDHQSVSEHILRTVYIGYTLAKMEKVDTAKVIQMCLFHDLGEARTSDLSWLQQKYDTADESRAVDDATKHLPFGADIRELYKEYEERESKESIVAKDADSLELLLSLRELADSGNRKGESWIPSLLQRIKTKSGKKLSQKILKTPSDNWWFGNKNDDWWLNRNKKSPHAK
ncbi:MAG: HD domain-containing protein [Candidatus Andersenbacteria bacterium]